MVRIGSNGPYIELAVTGTPSGILSVKMASVGMEARATVQPHPAHAGFGDFVEYLAGLERRWRGWDGQRSWQSLEGELSIAANHTGSHVELRVDLQRCAFDGTGWAVHLVLELDAGQELSTVAAAVANELRGALMD